jgi:hypothetical protein
MLPLQPTNAGNADAFVAKLNPTGSALVYSTYLGGSGEDYGFGIALDSTGNAYVTGFTNSSRLSHDAPEDERATLRVIKIPGPKSPDLGAGVFECARLKLTFGCLSRNRMKTV